MIRTFRRAATAIAMAAILAGTFGCSGVKKGSRVSAGPPDSAAAGSPAASVKAGDDARGRVTQAAFNEDADGARIVVTADVPLLYTAYEPRPDLLYIEMKAVASRRDSRRRVFGNLVQSVRIETIEELGKTLRGSRQRTARVLSTTSARRARSRAGFRGRESPARMPEPAPAPPAVAAGRWPLRALRAERPTCSKRFGRDRRDGVAVHLLRGRQPRGDGFPARQPPRLVIDLPGVKNSVRRRVLPVAGGSSRASGSPVPSAPVGHAIVLDLARSTPVHGAARRREAPVLVGDTRVFRRLQPRRPPFPLRSRGLGRVPAHRSRGAEAAKPARRGPRSRRPRLWCRNRRAPPPSSRTEGRPRRT